VRELYQFAVKPTVAFYYRVPLEVSLSRILTSRAELKYYEAGMDLGLSNDPQESFRLFQERIVHEYESMVKEFGLTVMDATLPIPEQQRRMRRIIRPYLQGVRRMRASAKESAWAGLAREMRPSQVDILGRTGR
jgi:dTMP kinase